jgi:hypothetical protein
LAWTETPQSQEMNMANTPQTAAEEPIPMMQQILDNPFLLLFIGILVPTLLYTGWGIMEIISIPMAK